MSIDDSFLAFGRAITGFNTFVQWNNRPAFRVACGGFGSINGVTDAPALRTDRNPLCRLFTGLPASSARRAMIPAR